MDCRTFHEHHLAFVDDTLPGADQALMERHRQECDSCERHDSLIRRGLFLARNIPRIQPSAGFLDRLENRLRDVKQDRRPVHLKQERPPTPLVPSATHSITATRLGATGTFGTVVIGMAACALLAFGVTRWMQLPEQAGVWSVTSGVSEEGAAQGAVERAGSPRNGSGGAGAPLRARSATTISNAGASHGYSLEMNNVAAQGYRLEMNVDPFIANYDGTRLLQDFELGIDPAIVASASAGLSLWPALMLTDDLPRVFRESGFSIADLSH